MSLLNMKIMVETLLVIVSSETLAKASTETLI